MGASPPFFFSRFSEPDTFIYDTLPLLIMNTVYVNDHRLHQIFQHTDDHLQFVKDAIDEKLDRLNGDPQ